MIRQVLPAAQLAAVVLLGCSILSVPVQSTNAPMGAEPLVQVFRHDFKKEASVMLEGHVVAGQGVVMDTEQGTALLPAFFHWVVPLPAGHTAKLTIDVSFPPLTAEGKETETVLGFFLSDDHCRKIRLHRACRGGSIVSQIQFLDVVEDGRNPKGMDRHVIREFLRSGDLSNGEWSFIYHYGLMLVMHAGQELGRAYLDGRTNVVTNVTWEQKQDAITCRSILLETVPHSQHSEGQNVLLQQAAQLNEKALGLLQSEKASEALSYVKQASDLYATVLGEDHHDMANSLANLASVLEKAGRYEQAQESYERALAIRRKVLGATHPDTALVLASLGIMMMAQTKYEPACKYFREALPIIEGSLGRENSAVMSMSDTLGQLAHTIEYQDIYRREISSNSRKEVLTAVENLKEAEDPKLDDANKKAQKALEALRILRHLQDPPPELAARAALVSGRMLEDEGRKEDALLFYDYCIRLHEDKIGFPRQDLSRALMFAGSLIESNDARTACHLRAIRNQHQVLKMMEANKDITPEILRAVREETAAVYVESAQDFFGFTELVVALHTNAIRLSLLTGNDDVVYTAAVRLFNQFLGWQDNHRHSELLLSVANFLERRDAARPVIRRDRVPGTILGYGRTAQELAAMNPPRPDLVKRYVLRLVALERIGNVKRPPYVGQYREELVKEMNLSDDVAGLELPDESIWPLSATSISRTELMKYLDKAAAPVDLAAEFPNLRLAVEAFPPVVLDVAEVSDELLQAPYMMQEIPDRLTPAALEAEISRCLSEDSRTD